MLFYFQDDLIRADQVQAIDRAGLKIIIRIVGGGKLEYACSNLEKTKEWLKKAQDEWRHALIGTQSAPPETEGD